MPNATGSTRPERSSRREQAARVSYRPSSPGAAASAEQFDLRGTARLVVARVQPRVLHAACRRADASRARARACPSAGSARIDVGCGTGFWTDYYVSRGAAYTGVDIAQGVGPPRRGATRRSSASCARGRERRRAGGPYDVVNVLTSSTAVTDDARWEQARCALAAAVARAGCAVTDVFSDRGSRAEHNVMRPLGLRGSAFARTHA
jgi:hypothetical protein